MASDPVPLESDAGTTSIEHESSIPRLLLETPTRPDRDNSATTPKRKRDKVGDDQADLATPTKRSNLEKGLIPDSFDMSSDGGSFGSGNGHQVQLPMPMKRSNDSVTRTAPSTPTKPSSRLQLGASQAHGALIDNPPSPLATSALSPLIRPRISDYTTTPEPNIDREIVSSPRDRSTNNEPSSGSINERSDHGIRPETVDEQCPPPSTNMTLSEAGNDDIFYEYPRTTVSQRAQDQHQEATKRVLPTPLSTPQRRSTATTTTTPQRSTSKLNQTPVIAPAYVPKYISTDSPVKLKDPKEFCVRPPFWKRWPTSRYVRFATFLQENVDLVPFAETEGLTVEEVQHVFHAVVTEPLLDETEKLAGMAAKRMESMFELLNPKVGLARGRVWRGEASSVQGELCGVRPGVVQLANENGELIEVPYGKLVKADQEFVLKAVTGEERGVLLRAESSV